MLALPFLGAAGRTMFLTAGISLALLLRVTELGLADEPAPPASPVEARVSPTSPTATLEAGAVGIDHDGRFAVTWHQGSLICGNNLSDVLIQYYHADGDLEGSGPVPLSGAQNPYTQIHHRWPSLSMSLNSHIRVAWMGDDGDWQPQVGPILVQQDFNWGDDPNDVNVPVFEDYYNVLQDPPSAGIANDWAACAAW